MSDQAAANYDHVVWEDPGHGDDKVSRSIRVDDRYGTVTIEKSGQCVSLPFDRLHACHWRTTMDTPEEVEKLKAALRDAQYEAAKAKRDRLDMMKRVRSDMRDDRRTIEQLGPRAQAYDLLTHIMGFVPGKSQGMRQDVLYTLDREIEQAEAENKG